MKKLALLGLLPAVVSASPAIDSGEWLLTVTGSGTSNRVPVQDAKIYELLIKQSWDDGVDTRIQFQGSMDRPTVVGTDGNILVLDREVTFTVGQGASFPYCGNAPDIGGVESDCRCGQGPIWDICSWPRPVPPELF